MSERFSQNPEWYKGKQIRSAHSLRKWSEVAVGLMAKDFSVKGRQNLEEAIDIQRREGPGKIIVLSSHLSNLDGPAGVKALGADFDLQMVVDEKNLGQKKF